MLQCTRALELCGTKPKEAEHWLGFEKGRRSKKETKKRKGTHPPGGLDM